MNPDLLTRYFQNTVDIAQQTTLRFVLSPERQEEVVEARRLFSEDFMFRVLEIGHMSEIRLFSYFQSKEVHSDEDHLIIDQTTGYNWRKGVDGVRTLLSEAGIIQIDSNVTGRHARENSLDIASAMIVAMEDVEAVLQADFRFAAALYNELDPYKRHQRFFWNASLSNLGYRTLTRNPHPGLSHTVNISGSQEPLLAFPNGRLITRDDLARPTQESERAVFLWEKRHDSRL